MERVVGDLAACGYDAEWDCFPAAAFGAPHLATNVTGCSSLPTPTNQGGGMGRVGPVRPSLDSLAKMWPTPRATDGSKGGRPRDQDWDSLATAAIPLADSDLARLEGRHGDELRERADQRASRQGGAFQDAAGAGWNGSRSVLAGAADRAGAFGQPARSDWWDVEPDVGRVAHGVPSRVDRLRCLGNAVVPQVAEWIGRQILAHAEGG
jgi:DNA (cytosine-5)-methyltransferase 1